MSLEETYYDYDSDDDYGVEDDDDDDVDYALANVTLPKRTSEVEDYYYEILSAEDIVRHMLDFIREANAYVPLSETNTRILLNHFKWDMQKFVNAFWNEDQEQLFEKAHIVNPFKESCDNPTSKPQSSNATEECEVCFVEIPRNMMTGLECGHQFCEDCWNEYLKTKIMDEGIVQTIQCAASSCEILVDDNYVMKLVKDSKVKQKYQRLISNVFVECHKLIKWCPSGCETAIMVHCIEPKPVRCKCNRMFCFECGENWHDPVDCNLLRKWSKRCKGDLEYNQWVLTNAKNCPKCDVPIEKNGGCNHMTCKNVSCGYEFCWLCLGSWARHHGCNRFNEQEAQAKQSALEQAKEKTLLALQRFTFFNDRYLNHTQSLKFENDLRNNVMEKMREARQQYDMTWNEVSFLEKAVEVLVSCRQTLLYTYVYAFYLEKNNQIEIFLENQKDLENAIEVLSGYLERDIAVQNLAQLKPKVQDKYKYCDKRRMVLLDHIHEGNDKKWWVFMDL